MAEPLVWTAEEHILGAMILSRKAIGDVVEVLEPLGEEKFERDSHGLLYRAMRRMDSDGQPVDAVTLCTFLETHRSLSRAGGKDRVRELATLAVVASNATHHARLVREAWARREVDLALHVNGDQPTAEGALDQAERQLLDVRIRIQSGGAKNFTSMYELAVNLEDRVKNPPKEDDGVPPPFAFLKPMSGGRVYILAGYTGDGKTVCGVQYAKAAAKRGLKVGFFSIEMSKEQLFDRFIASFGIPLHDVETGRIKLIHRPNYAAAQTEVSPWQVDVIDDRLSNSSTFLRAQRLRRYDLLIIDHLHEITLNGKSQDRRVLLEDEMHRITTLARQENVPVLLLAQLSRGSGGAPFQMPNLNLLRESGRIEQEAHMVNFIWRERDKQNQPLPEAWFIVAKNRSGPSGMRRSLDFIGNEVRFVEADREDVG